MIETEPSTSQGAPVRTVRLELPTHILSEALFGQGITVSRCTVVFHHMLPAPPEGTLQGVTDHGLVLIFDPQPSGDDEPINGLLVPWSQVSYVRFHHVS